MDAVKDLKDSVTLKFNELAREKNRKGEHIISLGIGEPLFETPSTIIEAACKAMKKGYTKYSHPLGLPELRQLIKEKLLRENGIDVGADNILVTPGAKNALSIALMSILRPGDEVINITPCYVSYIPQIKMAEPTAHVHNIDLVKDDFSIDWKKLETAVNKKTKAILINTPHNPTGRMFSESELGRLVELARKGSSYIISDEIYERLNFSGKPHYSVGSRQDIKDRVITINGFSKAFAMTGWRIGYLAAAKSVIDIASKIQQHINTNTCTFVQKGASAAFSLNYSHLTSYNKELKRKAEFMARVISSNKKLKLVSPEGGIFAFLNISKTRLGSDEFAAGLLSEKNVALIPGVSFGANWDDHVRVSLVAPEDEFENGIRLIDEFSRNSGGIS